jgi:hypothetical protein
MADEDYHNDLTRLHAALEASTTHKIIEFLPSEIQSLADRLFSLGVSKLFEAQPTHKADLRTAGALLRKLAATLPAGRAISVDVWRAEC